MMMQHGPYAAVIELDEEEASFHGRVVNLARDGFDFWRRDVEELRREFATSAQVYEEVCREQGEDPEKPYSGNFPVRADPELHRALVVAAARKNASLNAFVTEVLKQAVGV